MSHSPLAEYKIIWENLIVQYRPVLNISAWVAVLKRKTLLGLLLPRAATVYYYQPEANETLKRPPVFFYFSFYKNYLDKMISSKMSYNSHSSRALNFQSNFSNSWIRHVITHLEDTKVYDGMKLQRSQ